MKSYYKQYFKHSPKILALSTCDDFFFYKIIRFQQFVCGKMCTAPPEFYYRLIFLTFSHTTYNSNRKKKQFENNPREMGLLYPSSLTTPSLLFSKNSLSRLHIDLFVVLPCLSYTRKLLLIFFLQLLVQ